MARREVEKAAQGGDGLEGTRKLPVAWHFEQELWVG
jgi:hypothetical protein